MPDFFLTSGWKPLLSIRFCSALGLFLPIFFVGRYTPFLSKDLENAKFIASEFALIFSLVLYPFPSDGYLLRIDCNKTEDGLKTTPCSQCALDALAIDEPLEYARLALDGNLQMWVDAEDSLELW